jgi:hypothetical protein
LGIRYYDDTSELDKINKIIEKTEVKLEVKTNELEKVNRKIEAIKKAPNKSLSLQKLDKETIALITAIVYLITKIIDKI